MSRITPSVKEAVETIYELTRDGYTGNLSTLGDTVTIVNRLLQKNGALTVTKNQGPVPTYRWNEQAMAPTPVFIRKIDEEFRKYQNDMKSKPREQPKAKAALTSSKLGIHAVFPQPEPPSAGEPEHEPVPESVPLPPARSADPVPSGIPEGSRRLTQEELIARFSDEELWDELLRRGWDIKDNRLVKTIVMNRRQIDKP